MDALDMFLLWMNALLEILGFDLAGGFFGWYFAAKVLGPEYATQGICIGTLTGFTLAVFWTLNYGELSILNEENE